MAFYLRSGGGTPLPQRLRGRRPAGPGRRRRAPGLRAARRAARRPGAARPTRCAPIHQDARGVTRAHRRAASYARRRGGGGGAAAARRRASTTGPACRVAARRRRAPRRGCAVKVHLVYPAPLWREHGLSGWSVNAARARCCPRWTTRRPTAAWACSPASSPAREARRFAALPPAEQRAAALAQAARLFPDLPRADRLPRDRLGQRPLQPRLLRRAVRPGRLAPARPAPDHARTGGCTGPAPRRAPSSSGSWRARSARATGSPPRYPSRSTEPTWETTMSRRSVPIAPACRPRAVHDRARPGRRQLPGLRARGSTPTATCRSSTATAPTTAARSC